MVIRTIGPEEYQTVVDISDIAFAAVGEPRDSGHPPERAADVHLLTRAAFDDAGKMMASLQLIPYSVWYEGKEVGMGGIGGVSTLPEYRRQGSIRALMEHSLREMHERGMALSALYPFSHAYYRQFGYELACLRRKLEIGFDAFAGFRSEEPVCQWLPGQDDEPIRALYEIFASGTNLAVRRDNSHWKKRLDGDPYAKRKYTYLWRDDQGNPRAYAILSVEDAPDGKRLLMDDFACADPSATQGLFSLLRSMGAAYKKFVWKMPAWIDPNSLFPEPYYAEQRVEQHGMARLVNVGEALRLLRHPKERGSYTLRALDAQLPQNDGLWRVEFGEGQADVKKVQSGEADWTLDIRALTQLALGYHDTDSLMWGWPKLGAPSNAETLRRVFRRRKVYLADHF